MTSSPAAPALAPAIEAVILHGSRRGMDQLAPLLPPDFCTRAARALWAAPRGRVWITTGFYVGQAAETDGPPGAFFLAKALQQLGFSPYILTDAYCRGYFPGLPVEYLPILHPLPDSLTRRLLENAPVAAIAIERCGQTASGDYQTMRRVSIKAHTAPIDQLWAALPTEVLTIGVGDGGNEVGMGLLEEAIRSQLSLEPCVVPCQHLVVATVSNWGAYGLIAALGRLAGQPLLPTPAALEQYLAHLCALGCRDGVLQQVSPTVDGFPPGTEGEMLSRLQTLD